MTRMTRPDCAVMCNLINAYTHTHIYGPRDHRGLQTVDAKTMLEGGIAFEKSLRLCSKVRREGPKTE